MGACLCPVWSRDCSQLLLASAPLLAAGSGVCKRDYVSFSAVWGGRGVKASQGPAAATALPTAPLACRVLCRIPGEGTEASPFEKEEKIIISKPRNPELLGAYLSR